MESFAYPAKVVTDGKYRIITFRDIPECNWQIDDTQDLQLECCQALQYAMEFYFDDKKNIPFASKARKGEVCIELPVGFVSKIILHNTMIKNRYRPADLARALNVPTSEVARITNPKRKTKIDTMIMAIKACGGTAQLVSC